MHIRRNAVFYLPLHFRSKNPARYERRTLQPTYRGAVYLRDEYKIVSRFTGTHPRAEAKNILDPYRSGGLLTQSAVEQRATEQPGIPSDVGAQSTARDTSDASARTFFGDKHADLDTHQYYFSLYDLRVYRLLENSASVRSRRRQES